MPNICTRYHFATLFDTNRRIAVYSAYYFQPSDGGGREKRWFVEPQVGVKFFFLFQCTSSSNDQHSRWSPSAFCTAWVLVKLGEICCHLQLVDMSWQAGMKDGYWLGKDHPGVYLGERQALNEDYTHSGFDRGHLNPSGHHPGNRVWNIFV